MNNRYNTLSEAINELNQRGYTLDFTLQPDKIYSKGEDKAYSPDEFKVDEYHRFEGMTNPGDMSIVFAVTAHDGTKGTLTDAYGTYSDPLTTEMIEKMKVSD